MQKEGINYHDTFTPTSDLSLFRGLLSHAALHNWSVKHADIKNAFCQANIDVDNLFITMPNGITFHDPNPDSTRRRGIVLEKALYGRGGSKTTKVIFREHCIRFRWGLVHTARQ